MARDDEMLENAIAYFWRGGCPVCSSQEFRQLGMKIEAQEHDGSVRFECSQCGIAWTDLYSRVGVEICEAAEDGDVRKYVFYPTDDEVLEYGDTVQRKQTGG